MAANLTARKLRVFIGGDDQEWSFAAADFLPELESFGESGLIKTFAQVTLLDVLGNPESLDPRANPARWREGQTVRVDVATDAGGWFTWGYLRLLEIPSGPTDGRITLQLGCAIAWADDPQPEGDRSEVALGIGENSADVATRLLVASGIPEAAINLGVWDYDLPYALQKEGGGSYVAQAGALAFANHCRQLYQGPDGIIRLVQWSNLPGTSVATVTVGLNEALFVPNPDPVPPVERVVVSGVGYQPSTTPNRYSSSFTVSEPASNFSDTAAGSVGITTTEIFEWGEPTEEKPYYWTYSETRLRQPQAVTWIGSDSVAPATTITYEEKRYDATTKILYRVETGEIANVRTLVDGTVTAAGSTLIQRTIAEVEHDAALETLTRRTETTTVPRITLTGDTGETGRFVQETARVLDTRWTEDRPDYWVERTSERVAAKNGSGRQGNIKPTALITQRPQIKPNSRPPATERWEDPTSLKEQHYTAECTWQHPGGATGRVRVRSLTLTPGFSNAQCFDVATREVQLLEGRRESHLIELPLSDALLWLPPLSTITVNDGANEWQFKLDAIAWSYATGEVRLVAMGICVARVSVAVPVGTVLPEFESGVEPGQVAPEEPAVFVPPTNEFEDFAVAGVRGAATGSAQLELGSIPPIEVAVAGVRGAATGSAQLELIIEVQGGGVRGAAVGSGEIDVQGPIEITGGGVRAAAVGNGEVNNIPKIIPAGQEAFFILAGQSNAEGDGTDPSPPTLSRTTTYVKSGGYTSTADDGSFAALAHGINNSLEPDAEAEPLVYVAAAFEAQETANLRTVKVAIGGTDFDGGSGAWAVGGSLRESFVQRYLKRAIPDALDAGDTINFLPPLWIGNENAATNSAWAAATEAQLTDFIRDTRSTTGVATLPFVIVKLHDDLDPTVHPHAATVRTAQANVAAADANVYLLDPSAIADYDGEHYGAAGFEELANLYWALVNDTIGVTPYAVDADVTSFLGRLGGTYTTDEEHAIASLVTAGKVLTLGAGGSQWGSITGLYVNALDTATDGKQNLISTSYTLSDFNSPAFTARQGFTLDETNDYIRTGITPRSISTSTDGVYGFYARTNETGTGYFMCAFDSTQVIYIQNDANANNRIFGAINRTVGTITLTGSDERGANTLYRTGSTGGLIRNQGTPATATMTGAQAVNAEVWLGAFHTNNVLDGFHAAMRPAAVWVAPGAVWTTAETHYWHRHVEWLLDIFGAGVI